MELQGQKCRPLGGRPVPPHHLSPPPAAPGLKWVNGLSSLVVFAAFPVLGTGYAVAVTRVRGIPTRFFQ